MEVKCINSGNFKNLTEDNTYEIVKDLDGDFYWIKNDAEVHTKYSKKYFEEVIKIVTVGDLKDLNEFNIDATSLELNIMTPEKNWTLDWTKEEIAGNCGTAHFYGINEFYRQLKLFYSSQYPDVSEELIKEKVIEQLWWYISNYQLKEAKFVVYSTNDEYPEIWKLLDVQCDVSTEDCLNNDESGQIKIWIFYNF